MARSNLATILVATAFATLLIGQLVVQLRPSWQPTCFGFLERLKAPTDEQDVHKTSDSYEKISTGTKYLLGVGKADITGPVVEINLMGYADPNQVGTGLRQRLYSRAFIIGDEEDTKARILYVVLDTQSGDTAVRYGIMEALANLGDEYHMYGQHNVAIVGTHSHSGPGAWLNYLLPQITSKGFNSQSYRAIVDGTVLSIKRAHASLRPGHLEVGKTEVEDANINRSLYAYLANPAEERKKYKHDVEKEMTLLRFTNASNGKHMGVLTWFPVHGTSMLGNNTLISGDNKGVAATMFEKFAQSSDAMADGFVAGFSQASVGDTSPNVLGAYCEDGSGEQCSFKDSTCGGKNEPCHGRGPHFRVKDQGASSCHEIGRRQFEGAKTLFDRVSDIGNPMSGPVRSLHSFQDLSNFTFNHPNGSHVRTCPAALGYSFAAGTTDGPGAFDFKQNNPGDPEANPLWSVVRGFIKEPSEKQSACHAPKPILLDVGEMSSPYTWAPNIVDVQVLRVGQLIIVVSPGEATTMAGRRWKDAIKSHAQSLDLTSSHEPIVVLGGPANSYTHYIATEEEYAVQRYEGASTLYGPHTLNAHIDLTTSYLHYLATNASGSPPSGPYPPNNVNASLSLITPVIRDGTPFFSSFGDILTDVNPSYRRGETVTVVFVGANPRNNLRLEDTYVSIERKEGGGKWKRVRDDSDWSVIFRWERKSTLLGTSEVRVTWEIEREAERGMYRVVYLGDSKGLGGTVTGFKGVSGEFDIR